MIPFENKYIRLRIAIVGFLFSIFFLAIGAKAVYVQIFRGPWLSEKAAGQYEKSFIFHGKRGTIYDTKYREMAVSIDATSIAAYPHYINNSQITAKPLAKALKINISAVKRKLSSKKSFVWIKRQITPREKKAVEDLNIDGIGFIPEHTRFYPNRMLAAQLLGFSGIDSHGLEGIEFYYDKYLKGSSDKFTVLKDALGREFSAEKKVVPIYNGKNLILTIDRTIQYITEKALEEAVNDFSAKSGIAIVIDPNTGAVLSLAHFPFFNPNSFQDFSREKWRNRAITDPFEPGSTMKIFTAAAALEYGNSTPDTIFFCENGAYRIGKNIIHDTKPHGWMSLQQIVKYSSNIGAVKVGEKIGQKALYQTLRDFGFGKKTGIDCPGETTGSLTMHDQWSKIDAGTISFGQGISVSAIQLITAASAIANDGILMKPYITRAVYDQNGRLVQSFSPYKVRRVVSKKTARAVNRIMKTVIATGGTGVRAALKAYSVSGKTGTAQKIDKTGTYAKGKYMASFIGFAPSENPKVTILVIIDEPQKKYYGSIVAAPVFKKIANETLNYLNISPKSGNEKLTVSIGSEVIG